MEKDKKLRNIKIIEALWKEIVFSELANGKISFAKEYSGYKNDIKKYKVVLRKARECMKRDFYFTIDNIGQGLMPGQIATAGTINYKKGRYDIDYHSLIRRLAEKKCEAQKIHYEKLVNNLLKNIDTLPDKETKLKELAKIREETRNFEPEDVVSISRRLFDKFYEFKEKREKVIK